MQNLYQHPLFQSFAPDETDRFLADFCCTSKHFQLDEPVLSEGDPADKIGLVLFGAVQVEKYDFDGNRSIFAVLREGDLFNEAFAFSSAAHMTVSIRAVSPSDVLLIPVELLLRSPVLVRNLLRLMGEKMFLFDRRMEVLSRRKTRDRLLFYLQQQSELNQSRCFTIPCNRQELADYLGVDRSGLSVEIHRLIKDKKIKSKGSFFEILL